MRQPSAGGRERHGPFVPPARLSGYPSRAAAGNRPPIRSAKGDRMNRKRISGLVGIVFGGAWLANNFRYFHDEGFVAIGMPLIIFVLGIVYFFTGRDSTE
jgi:hypothetical protein